MIVSSAVAPLTTQTPSKEREERTGNLELKFQVDPDRNNLKYPNRSLRHSHAMYEKGSRRQVETFIVEVLLCRVLNMLADQLVVQYELQDSLVFYPLAAQRLRAKVILCAALKAQASIRKPKYPRIDEELTSDICGINHCAIPDTLRMTQYRLELVAGLNPARIAVGSDKAQLLQSSGTKMTMMVASILLEDLRAEELHDELRVGRCAQRCRDVCKMDLPYAQAINLRLAILPMVELKTHQWISFQCPDEISAQSAEKINQYLKSAWCKIVTEGRNTVTALMLKL